MEEENIKKKNEIILLILAFCILLIFANYQKNSYFEEIKSYKSKTIGKANKIKSGGKVNYLEYYFYYNNKKYLSTSKHNDFDKDYLKKFFLVVFDKKKPENSHIYLENEIKPDSIKMIRAGYKHSYYFEYDIPTNTYVKKHKWE